MLSMLLLPSAKPDSYYQQSRADFLDWVAPTGQRALDLGCGAGGLAPALRARGFTYLAGVELDPSAAAQARPAYDLILAMSIDEALPLVSQQFDVIVCADVLEHLQDPWSVLVQLRRVAHRDSVLAVSVPNIRHLSALLRIAVGKGFRYEESGIFDSTHLRFFTREDTLRMLRDSGWTPVRIGAPPPGRFRRVRQFVRAVTRGWTCQWSARQTWVVCVATP